MEPSFKELRRSVETMATVVITTKPFLDAIGPTGICLNCLRGEHDFCSRPCSCKNRIHQEA
jgi:hypothetical protein